MRAERQLAAGQRPKHWMTGIDAHLTGLDGYWDVRTTCTSDQFRKTEVKNIGLIFNVWG